MKSKMTKSLVGLLLAIILVLGVWYTVGRPPAEDETVELRFTSVSVPGDTHTRAMGVFAEKVEELTDGSVIVHTFDSGSLFTAENEFDAILTGNVDMAYLSNPTISTKIPYFTMLTSGYFFKNYDHMTSVLNGDIGVDRLRADIEEQLGIVVLSSFYLGSRTINTRDREINSFADMEGLLLRMPNSPAWLFLGSALGANPTPMSFSEVYTGLSTGAIDGQDNPLPTIQSAKFYEVTDYIAITNHVIDSIHLSLNKDSWNQLSDRQQTALREAAEYARNFTDTTNIAREAELIEYFEGQGLTVTHPSIDEFRQRVQEAYLNNAEMIAQWDMELYEQIQALAN